MQLSLHVNAEAYRDVPRGDAARMAEAAPDLLEAVLMVLGNLAGSDSGYVVRLSGDQRDQLRSAIAKATGGQS